MLWFVFYTFYFFLNFLRYLYFFVYKAECYNNYGAYYGLYEYPFMEMDAPACMVLIDGVMFTGTYAVGVKVSDYILGNPTPMSTIPAKYIVQILPDNGCNTRF